MSIIQELEQEHATELEAKRPVPEFAPGDTVRVNVKVVEGTRERVQAYEGVCIARAGGGLNESYTVRKISYGEGVERVFPIHSPLIESISVVRRGRVRRAKLYYLRGRRGKSARIPERQDARQKKDAAKKRFKGFKKPKGAADDMTRISGVDDELRLRLKKLGIIKYEQFANFTDEDIANIDEALELEGRIEREDWIAQTQTLIAEATADEVPAEDEAEASDAEETKAKT